MVKAEYQPILVAALASHFYGSKTADDTFVQIFPFDGDCFLIGIPVEEEFLASVLGREGIIVARRGALRHGPTAGLRQGYSAQERQPQRAGSRSG